MRRRRLVVFAMIAMIAMIAMAGVVPVRMPWLRSNDQFTPEEQQFVGTWRRSTNGGSITFTLELLANRRWVDRIDALAGWGGEEGRRWAVRAGVLILAN